MKKRERELLLNSFKDKDSMAFMEEIMEKSGIDYLTGALQENLLYLLKARNSRISMRFWLMRMINVGLVGLNYLNKLDGEDPNGDSTRCRSEKGEVVQGPARDDSQSDGSDHLPE